MAAHFDNGLSVDLLKRRCCELCMALDRWQKIALLLNEGGIDALPDDMRDDLLTVRSLYNDNSLDYRQHVSGKAGNDA